jgi:hypothetical protein
MDKDIYKKIAKLATYDLSILAKDDLHRAQLQTLQSMMLVSQDASYSSNNLNNKKILVKRNR